MREGGRESKVSNLPQDTQPQTFSSSYNIYVAGPVSLMVKGNLRIFMVGNLVLIILLRIKWLESLLLEMAIALQLGGKIDTFHFSAQCKRNKIA